MIKNVPQNLLITCAGRRNYLINYFKKELKDNGKIVAVDQDLSSAALTEADVVYKVSGIDNRKYVDELKAIVKKEKVNAIISLNDIELPLLSKSKNEFAALGAQVLVSDSDVIDMCFDKWQTYLFLKNIGLSTPSTFLSINAVKKAIKKQEISYPLIIKPRWGSASLGIHEVGNEAELMLAYQFLKIVMDKNSYYHPSLEGEVERIIIQEKIIGQEYGMDILNDFNGKYYGSFVRKKIAMRCGETDKAISVIDKDYCKIGAVVGGKTGHIGIMDCDFLVSDEKVYFLEMNPRFGGGYPFSHEAGINITAIYLFWLKGRSDIEKFNNYRSGLGFAKFDQTVKIGNDHK